MAAGIIVVPSLFPARNRNNALVSGALLAVYDNRTTTKAEIFSDEAMTTPLANPVVANSSGQFPVVWTDAGTSEEPTLYTISISGPGGISIANPSVFHDWQPSLDADAALAAIVTGAAESAESSAVRAESALEEIEQIAEGSPDAPSVLNKANISADNINDSVWRSALGLGDSAVLDVGTTSGTVAAGDDARLQAVSSKANAAADNITGSVWRTALGLGDSATRSVGTSSGTVAAGDDSRILRVVDFATRTAAQAATIPAPQAYLRTGGYTTAGDLGGALYTRASSGQLQTADGQWWEIAETSVTPEMFGAKGDGSTDDTAAINAAIAFSKTREVVLQDRSYKVTTVNFSRSIALRGLNKWYSKLVGSTTNTPVLEITAEPVELTNLTIDRSAVPVDGGIGLVTKNGGYGKFADLVIQNHYDGILLRSTASAELSNVISQFNYRHGVRGEVTSTGAEPALQWKMTNVISQMNNGLGYQFYAFGSTNLQTGFVAINCGAFRNGQGGWRFAGESGTAWNDINMYHCYSSFDNGHGFDWQNCGANNQMFNTFCEWNGMVGGGREFDNIPASEAACGVLIQGASPSGSSLLLTGLVVQNSALDALMIDPSSTLRTLQVCGSVVRDNGQAEVAFRKSGIASASTTTNIYLTNVVSRREGYTTQEYGISTDSTTVAGKVFAWGCDFRNNFAPSQNAASSYGAWIAVPATW